MFIARTLVPDADGVTPRILVSTEPSQGWIDVRASEIARLARRRAGPQAARRLAAALVPGSLTAALEGGDAFLEALEQAAADRSGDVEPALEPRLICPVDAPLYRDFMAFERHFRFGSEVRGVSVPNVLYELPVSYIGNAAGLFGPGCELAWPHYSSHMDYELELGIVVGRPCRDLTPAQAADHILGLTILNDFSARDIQLHEMQGGLGPCKGKHFGSAVGPWIATLDELPATGLRMQARVNGELWSDADSAEMIWSIDELTAWACAAEPIPAGSLLGTGTANGGSGIELGRRLAPGDEIALTVEKLGTLTTSLTTAPAGWTPAPRRPSV